VQLSHYRASIGEFILASTGRATREGLLVSWSIAVVLAGLYWAFIVLVMEPAGLIKPWFDQRVDFTQVGHHLGDPYQTPGFVNPPWTAVFLWPFSQIPLELAVFIQLCLFFVVLATAMHKFGGTSRTVLIVLGSYIGFDYALEVNIDWLPVLGLLVPAAWSGIFLLTKPQVALGVWLSYSRWRLMQALGVTGILLAVTVIIWGFWPLDMREALDRYLSRQFYEHYNLAPSILLPAPVSWVIGLAIGWRAFRRRDSVLSILAWLFFIPYLPFYSVLVYYALFAIRFPLIALIINISLWVVILSVFLYVLVLAG
jgi:hypothetical protein